MGKLAIILISLFAVTSALYSLTVNEGTLAVDKSVADHQYETLARNAALLGFERAKQQVIDDFTNLGTVIGTTEHGTYEVTLAASGTGLVDLRAVGSAATPRGNVTHKVYASVEQKMVAAALPEDAPAFLDYSLLVDKNLTLQGNTSVAVYAQGDAANQLNSNMHTNGNLHVDGMKSSVQGFGTYVGSATANPPKALETTFTPNYNPANGDGTQQVAQIPVPAFDMALFAANVTLDQTTTGDVTLSGDVDLGGTREDPYVWHITGSLSTTGNTTIDGYVIFLVENDITFAGNTRAGNSGFSDSDESSMAFYAADDITLTGTSVTDGQVYAADDIDFQGTATIYGTVTVRGDAVISGTPNLYYRKASPGLAVNFEPTPMVPKYFLAGYSEK